MISCRDGLRCLARLFFGTALYAFTSPAPHARRSASVDANRCRFRTCRGRCRLCLDAVHSLYAHCTTRGTGIAPALPSHSSPLPPSACCHSHSHRVLDFATFQFHFGICIAGRLVDHRHALRRREEVRATTRPATAARISVQHCYEPGYSFPEACLSIRQPGIPKSAQASDRLDNQWPEELWNEQ